MPWPRTKTQDQLTEYKQYFANEAGQVKVLSIKMILRHSRTSFVVWFSAIAVFYGIPSEAAGQDILFPGKVRERVNVDDCRSPSDLPGRCIIIYSCSPLLDLLKTRTPSSVEFLRKSACGFENNSPKVCCPRLPTFGRPSNNGSSSSSSASDADTKPLIGSEGGSGNLKPNLTVTPGEDKPVQLSTNAEINPFSEDCGFGRLLNRIHGGTNSLLGAYPWMSIIAYQDPRNPALVHFLCGGALITRKHIITAAHCLMDDQKNIRPIVFVRLGESNLFRDDDGASPVDVGVVEVTPHHLYERNPQIVNDIGIIHLQKPVTFTDMIGPVCLPDNNHKVNLEPGKRVIVAGWGSDGVRRVVPQLQEVSIPLVERSACQKEYTKHNISILDTYICAAEPGRDSCSGDSGGPLMLPLGPQYVLVGVLSFGSVLCDGNLPGVYTRTESYVEWIREVVIGSNFQGKRDSGAETPQPISSSVYV